MRSVMFGLSLIMLFAVMAVAADQAPTVTLQYTDADILDALASISQQAQVSVVADATVKGKVSCGLTGMAVADALDVICKPNKLEWYKAYAGVGAEKPSASKLFKLMDALKDLGSSALICEDPKNQAQTIFVPSATGSVDNSAIASQLKLKEVYMIRAIPDLAAIAAAKAKANQNTGLASAPPSDPQQAAQQAMNWFGQMPQQQAMEAMHDLRQMVFDSMTPEQRQAYFAQMRQNGGGRGGRGGPNGGNNPNDQGGQHRQHQDTGQ